MGSDPQKDTRPTTLKAAQEAFKPMSYKPYYWRCCCCERGNSQTKKDLCQECRRARCPRCKVTAFGPNAPPVAFDEEVERLLARLVYQGLDPEEDLKYHGFAEYTWYCGKSGTWNEEKSGQDKANGVKRDTCLQCGSQRTFDSFVLSGCPPPLRALVVDYSIDRAETEEEKIGGERVTKALQTAMQDGLLGSSTAEKASSSGAGPVNPDSQFGFWG
jgi:hypothetical protein